MHYPLSSVSFKVSHRFQVKAYVHNDNEGIKDYLIYTIKNAYIVLFILYNHQKGMGTASTVAGNGKTYNGMKCYT